MGWTKIPVSADALISEAEFNEVMSKIQILWDVFPASIWTPGIGSRLIEPPDLPHECCGGLRWFYYVEQGTENIIDIYGLRYYGSGLGWLRRIVEDMHDHVKFVSYSGGMPRYYLDSGVPVQRQFPWVMNEATGNADWIKTTQGGSPWHRGSKLRTVGDCLTELRTVLDYIKDWAIVRCRYGFSQVEYSHIATVSHSWSGPDHETVWSSARSRATDNAVSMYSVWGGFGYSAMKVPFVSMILSRNALGWRPWYSASFPNSILSEHTNPIVVEARGPTIIRCGSGGWHPDLKRPACHYWLAFAGDPNWGSVGLNYTTNKHAGVLPLPYTLNGVDIEGGCPENGGEWISPRYVPFYYDDWDWENDRGDLEFDDSDWAGSIYVPSSDLWDGGDEGESTGFVWSQVPPSTIYVRPDYADY